MFHTSTGLVGDGQQHHTDILHISIAVNNSPTDTVFLHVLCLWRGVPQGQKPHCADCSYC
eukprot:1142944-Pelagomonas_calceolata.AAC.2